MTTQTCLIATIREISFIMMLGTYFYLEGKMFGKTQSKETNDLKYWKDYK